MSINITDAIFARAERQPDVPAIISPQLSISYRALCRGVCHAAQRVHQTGWKAGDIVGIALRDSPILHLISSLALARAGVTQASIPMSDPQPLRQARIHRLGIQGLVVSKTRDACGLTACISNQEWLKEAADSAPPEDIREPGGDRLWIINETSGTTATPKVIGLSHVAEDAHYRRQKPISAHQPGERFLSLTALQFLSALKRTVYCLSDGGTVTFPPPILSTEQVLQWIERHQVAYITCVPLHLHNMLRDITADAPRLPALRILRAGTAALSLSAIDDIRTRITPNLYISYGTSETGSIATATPELLRAYPGTVGRPLPGLELEIVDGLGELMPAGTLGHLRVRGPGIDSAYLHAEPEQANAFRDGWFYPGDVAVGDGNGLLFLKGRSDEVMNFDGIMVGPAEIESVLRQHPAVQEVAAFALPSKQHQEIPAAAIVSQEPLPTSELRHFCLTRLGVKAPRLFLQIDEIPKNPSGKVLRRQLVELAIARDKAKRDTRGR